MYDIKLLEEKWDTYNRKRRKPFYKWVVIIAVMLLISAALFYKKDVVQTYVVSHFPEMTGTAKSAATVPVLLDGPIDTLSLKETTSAMPVMNTEQRVPHVRKRAMIVTDDNPMDPSDVFVDEDAGSSTSFGSKKRAKKSLNIEVSEMTGSTVYQDVEDRFHDAPEADDALFLAREYYSQRKYNKAAYWALQTNKLDGDIEESWLIFAKAKAKLGQKNEAIRVLSAYAKKSNSKAAQTLLRKLKN